MWLKFKKILPIGLPIGDPAVTMIKLKTLKKFRTTILLFAFFLLGTGFGFLASKNQVSFDFGGEDKVTISRLLPEDKQDVNFALFWQVWDRLQNRYLQEEGLNEKEMVYGAIKGMTAALGDPYTVFLPPEDNKRTKQDLNGSFEGVGIQLGYEEQQLAVIAPLKGMPAIKQGVRAGDLILQVDGKSTEAISLPEAVEWIRGPKGSSVTLTLYREGLTEFLDVSITRDTIVVPTVEIEFIDDVAHLQLSRFGDRTTEEWLKAVDKIVSRNNLKGIVLDLRNNPGGYLNGSVFITSEFISDGVVVYQENSDGTKEVFKVNRTGKLTGQDLVVLINKGSASASEIVAGALKDHERAVIVGETSFGKGTIQEAEDFNGGAGLHVTTARWLLPSEDSINKEGITPNVEVKDDLETEEVDEQLEKAIELLL